MTPTALIRYALAPCVRTTEPFEQPLTNSGGGGMLLLIRSRTIRRPLRHVVMIVKIRAPTTSGTQPPSGILNTVCEERHIDTEEQGAERDNERSAPTEVATGDVAEQHRRHDHRGRHRDSVRRSQVDAVVDEESHRVSGPHGAQHLWLAPRSA